MAGGLIAHLVPTVIILAAYVSCTYLIRQTICRFRQTLHPQYLFCDAFLLFQIYYYRWKNPRADEAITRGIDSEDTPLLENSVEPKSTGCWNAENEVLRCSLYLIFVFVAGTLAWAIDLAIRGPSAPREPEGIIEWRSQILGWISAASFRTSYTAFNFAHSFTHSRRRSSGRSNTTNS